MTPEEWLADNVEGYNDLSQAEREEIRYFSLLWSLFEFKMLGTEGSARKICEKMTDLEANNIVNPSGFAAPIAYFSDRYYKHNAFSANFDDLHWKGADRRPFVESVLSGGIHSDAQVISAFLIIVYRLRNNLFHGTKWKYTIRGQLENFKNANLMLMAALDL